jgi:hypothetical protein
MKTYRFTYRMEVFISAPDEKTAQQHYEVADLTELDTEYVELVSVEEYDEPFGTPVE